MRLVCLCLVVHVLLSAHVQLCAMVAHYHDLNYATGFLTGLNDNLVVKSQILLMDQFRPLGRGGGTTQGSGGKFGTKYALIMADPHGQSILAIGNEFSTSISEANNVANETGECRDDASRIGHKHFSVPTQEEYEILINLIQGATVGQQVRLVLIRGQLFISVWL